MRDILRSRQILPYGASTDDAENNNDLITSNQNECDVPLTLKSYRKQGMESQLYCESHLPDTPVALTSDQQRSKASQLPPQQQPAVCPNMDDKTRHELFSMLEKMHSSRIDDQRCAMPNILQHPDFMETLLRLQSRRLEDQRCMLPPTLSQTTCLNRLVNDNNNFELPPGTTTTTTTTGNSIVSSLPHGWTPDPALAQILRGSGPYPMIVQPKNGGYWIDGEEKSSNLPVPAAGDDWNNRSSPRTSTPMMRNGTTHAQPCRYQLEVDETAKCFRKHFLGREHFNFYGEDTSLGPIVMSIKSEVLHDGTEHTRVILRRKNCTIHKTVPVDSTHLANPAKIAKLLCESLALDKLQAVLHPHGSELIVNYDEHVLANTYKFGVVYQRFGQTLEEEVFSNERHSPAMDQFLDVLGTRVKLKDFKGFRGGLDTRDGQTGEESVYTTYHDKEIMFHVSTLLPYTAQDPQQVQRKRHIGNDIVAIVFQEDNTPFVPDMIASHFLHAYIVVQPVDPCTPHTSYKVTVTARSDVPSFGPRLPEDAIFVCADDLRDFLLTKLINAEHACYRAEKFAKLEERTRSALLDNLLRDLEEKNRSYMNHPPSPQSAKTESSTGLFDTFKRAISGKGNKKQKGLKRNYSEGNALQKRNQNSSFDNCDSPCTCPKQSGGENFSVSSYKTCSDSPVSPRSSPGSQGSQDIRSKRRPIVSRSSSSSSFNSFGEVVIEQPGVQEDSDTGMESMSSTETGKEPKRVSLSNSFSDDQGYQSQLPEHNESLVGQVELLKAQVNKLSTEKSHLQNLHVSSQKEIQRLKDRETRLATDLSSTVLELRRLKVVVLDVGPEATV